MDTVFYFKNIDNQPARRKLNGFLEFVRQARCNIQTISPDTRIGMGLEWGGALFAVMILARKGADSASYTRLRQGS